MSELVRSAIVRLRGAFGAHCARRSVHLPLSVSLSELSPPGGQRACTGHTCDLSSTGLSFMLPTIRLGSRHIFSEGGTVLRIRLELPGGVVEMSAAPVRYDTCDGWEGGQAYLVGAQILDIAGDDRARYLAFLRAPRRASQVEGLGGETCRDMA
jgi:hypothetical protein